jgi:hypothetical protein
MKKALLIISLALVFPALTSSSALAEGGKVRFGNLAIIPSMGFDEVYDDNIYYDKTSTVSDWITHYRPGLLLDYTITGRGKIKLGYAGDYAYYSDNRDNNWKNHKILFDLDYLSPGGLIAKIKNELEHSEDPYGDRSEYNLGVKSKRWSDDLQAAAGFKFSDRFKILAYYNFYRQDYKNNNGGSTGTNGYNNTDFIQDYYYSEEGIGFETKVTHKTWVFLRYYFGSQKYFTHRDGITSSNDASYDWRRVNTGLAWDEGGRFRGELNFGYQWNSYKNSRDQYDNRYQDQNNWIAQTRVDYRQTEARAFRFTVTREMLQLEAGASGNYMNTVLGIGVRQKIRKKFFLDLSYEYATHKYNGNGYYYIYSSSGTNDNGYFAENRKDTLHHVRTALEYTIKEWLTARVEYNYIQDTSNESLSEYKINRFGISLDFKPAAYH